MTETADLWRPLRTPIFRQLLIADVVSDVGTFMKGVGSAWLMVSIGAGPLFALILGGMLSPVLRDMAYGSVMMAEHWFGVSDHVTIEPFASLFTPGILLQISLIYAAATGSTVLM